MAARGTLTLKHMRKGAVRMTSLNRLLQTNLHINQPYFLCSVLKPLGSLTSPHSLSPPPYPSSSLSTSLFIPLYLSLSLFFSFSPSLSMPLSLLLSMPLSLSFSLCLSLLLSLSLSLSPSLFL